MTPRTTEKKQPDACIEEMTAPEVLTTASGIFSNNTAVASSFGIEDMVILDLMAELEIPFNIFYIDTGLLFPETHRTIERAKKHYQVEFLRVTPELSLSEQNREYGPELWKSDPDLCCRLRKVQPLARVLSDYGAWVTGIRREQSPTRAEAKKIEWDPQFGLYKINPLADWSWDQVWEYIHANDVPYNPLHDNGYPSIGCRVCTRPVASGTDFRAGRWQGQNKTECGLHPGGNNVKQRGDERGSS